MKWFGWSGTFICSALNPLEIGECTCEKSFWNKIGCWTLRIFGKTVSTWRFEREISGCCLIAIVCMGAEKAWIGIETGDWNDGRPSISCLLKYE